jgi:hypothetical protein
MKGVTLPIETIVILVLAIIVFGVLLWFFVLSSSPSMNIAQLKQQQSILCSSYQERNVYCSKSEHENMVYSSQIAKIIEICYQINLEDNTYPNCDEDLYDNRYNEEDQAGKGYYCVTECCHMFC